MAVLPVVSRTGGAVLATATRAVAALRTARKPLHPRGQTWNAVLTRHGVGEQPTGVSWIDTPGSTPATVRVSAAIGLPTVFPDIHGVAVRLQQEDGPGDILLATTGTAPVLRHVLRFSRSPSTSVHTSLLPCRSPKGPLLFAATPRGERRFDLAYAIGQGSWHRFGTLELIAPTEGEISYDPVLNPPQGLENYSWVARLRAPAYRTARASRADAEPE